MTTRDKIDYFIERTDRDLSYLKKQVDGLTSFKWMLLGMSFAVSAATGTVSTLVMLYLEYKK